MSKAPHCLDNAVLLIWSRDKIQQLRSQLHSPLAFSCQGFMFTLWVWTVGWCRRLAGTYSAVPLPSLGMHGSSAVRSADFVSLSSVVLSFLVTCVSGWNEVILTWQGLADLGARLEFSYHFCCCPLCLCLARRFLRSSDREPIFPVEILPHWSILRSCTPLSHVLTYSHTGWDSCGQCS